MALTYVDMSSVIEIQVKLFGLLAKINQQMF